MFDIKVKGVKDTSLGSVDLYPILTGTEIDFLCSTEYIQNDGKVVKKIGINNGNCICLAGISNSGKSTLALDIAGRGLRKYEKSSVIHFDTENGMTPAYMMKIMGLPKEKMDEKVTYFNRANCSVESITAVMEQVVEQKKANIKEYQFDTGLKNKITGKKVIGVAPTYIIIDSWMKLRSEKVKEDGYNMMTDATEAKNRGRALEYIKDNARELNFIVIIVTHSGEKIHTGYGSPKTEFQGLANTTVVNGGKTLKYECEIMLFADKYLESKADRVKDIMKNDRIDYITRWVIFKSRLSSAGKYIAMCKQDKEAFSFVDSIQYSMMQKEYGLIIGPRFDKKEFNLAGYSEEEKKELYTEKFNLKYFSTLMGRDQQFKNTVFRLMMDYWHKIVEEDRVEKEEQIDVVKDIFD